MKKLFIASLSLVAAFNASADAINKFTWTFSSSDDKMYVCNAGIMHSFPKTGHVDANSGGLNSGLTTTTHDWITLNYNTLDMNMDKGPNQTAKIEAGTAFNSAFSNTDAFKRVVTSMNVLLGSENYGAKYYVDVCYRGNQFDWSGGIVADYKLVQNQLTYNELTDASYDQYRNNADLKVSSVTSCTRDADINTAGAGLVDMHNPASVTISGTTQAVPFVQGNGVSLNIGNAQPKFCKTRYIIEEATVATPATNGTGTCRLEHWTPGDWHAYYNRTQAWCNAQITEPTYGGTVTNRTFQMLTPGNNAIPKARDWALMHGNFEALTEIEFTTN